MNACAALDVYAPSLHAYFDKLPERWVNDVLGGDIRARDEMTKVLKLSAIQIGSENYGIGCSNSQKENVFKLEGAVSRHLLIHLFHQKAI